MADVFGVEVGVAERPGSAALGAAFRALHALICEREQRLLPFRQVLGDALPLKKTIAPDRQAHRLYTKLLGRYADLEQTLCSAGKRNS